MHAFSRFPLLILALACCSAQVSAAGPANVASVKAFSQKPGYCTRVLTGPSSQTAAGENFGRDLVATVLDVLEADQNMTMVGATEQIRAACRSQQGKLVASGATGQKK